MTFLTINFMPTKYRIMKNKREGFIPLFFVHYGIVVCIRLLINFNILF